MAKMVGSECVVRECELTSHTLSVLVALGQEQSK